LADFRNAPTLLANHFGLFVHFVSNFVMPRVFAGRAQHTRLTTATLPHDDPGSRI